MIKEKWKIIDNYTGYEVSNFGRIRSLDRIIMTKGYKRKSYPKFYKGKIKKLDTTVKGYKRAELSYGKKELVHRLVGKIFIPNPHKKPCINHLDNNPKNNNVENLEWVTYSENQLYCSKQGRHSKVKAFGESCGAAKLTEKQVKEIRKLAGTMSYRKIGRQFGVVHATIKNIIVRNNWKHI
jgi:hypothetical protein